MKYYTYDENGIFTGDYDYNNMRPARSTFAAPDSLMKGMWKFVNGGWVAYNPEPEVEEVVRKIETIDFLDKFNDATLDGILSSDIPAVKTFVMKVQLRPWINLNSPVLKAALDSLVLATLMTEQEVTDLLA